VNNELGVSFHNELGKLMDMGNLKPLNEGPKFSCIIGIDA
jgi:hypothetical protein